MKSNAFTNQKLINSNSIVLDLYQSIAADSSSVKHLLKTAGRMASTSSIIGLAALVFCTWAVSLAGIASIQDQCTPQLSEDVDGIVGLTSGLPCMKLFRYHWFVVCIEFALIVGLAASIFVGALPKTRGSWMGLFCVAALLYIQMSDTFLTMETITEGQGQFMHRVRTMIAGSIMTATVNCMLIFALGMVPESATEATAAVAEKAAAV